MDHVENQQRDRVRTIWMVSREYRDLAGVGGVKDVCRDLAETLAGKAGRQVAVVLPCYGFLQPERLGFTPLPLAPCAIRMDYAAEERTEEVTFLHGELDGVDIYLVRSERFAEKDGIYTYTAAEQERDPRHRTGQGHVDYFATNVLLEKAALSLAVLLDVRPQVMHCHDGHTALVPVMARELCGFRPYFRNTGFVVTIHNAGLGYHQEVDDLDFAAAITALGRRIVDRGLLGRSFDPFVSAADHALLNTVSEHYARELQESAEDHRTGGLGHLLALRGIRLRGITNGIRPEPHDPRRGTEIGLAAAFDPGSGDMEGKRRCKEDMLDYCAAGAPAHEGLPRSGSLSPRPDLPLFTFVGRLAAQKGVDLLVEACVRLAARDQDFQVLILGSGDAHVRDLVASLVRRGELAGRAALIEGHDEGLARRVFAAGDFLLIPSLYEPCGLTDYMAQLMGNLPIVRNVGGLNKVIDRETGLVCREHRPEALAAVMAEALRLYKNEPDTLERMRRAAVRRIHERHTWDRVVEQYLDLYAEAMP